MAVIHDFDRHPRRVQERIRAYAADLNKVKYQTSINDLVRAKIVVMSDVWECLENGEVIDEHLYFEADGTYAKLVCHTGDGAIFLDIKIMNSEDILLVLYATKEDD